MQGLEDSSRSHSFVFEGFEFIGDHLFGVAAPPNTDTQLKRNILAAIKAYHFGFSSIDYVLKKHGRNWFNIDTTLTQCQELLITTLNTSKKYYELVLKKRSTLKDLPDIFGLIAAGAALIRLNSSFKSAFFLLYNGNFIEGYCILKLILEQIAWAYSVYQIPDEKLYKILPSKSITSLKELIPEAGELYGRLNKSAHIDTSQIDQHVDFSGSEPYVILASQERCLVAAWCMLKLADMFGIIMETIYAEHISEFEFIVKSDGKYIPNKKRKSLKDLESLRKKIIKYVKAQQN